MLLSYSQTNCEVCLQVRKPIRQNVKALREVFETTYARELKDTDVHVAFYSDGQCAYVPPSAVEGWSQEKMSRSRNQAVRSTKAVKEAEAALLQQKPVWR